MKAESRRKFVLIPGGLGMEGPITRLGLWDRFSGPSPAVWVLLGVSKLLMLGALAYWVFG